MRFVVGVDGSEPSRRACEFAAELAGESKAQVKCVFVRHLSAATGLAATRSSEAVGLALDVLDDQEIEARQAATEIFGGYEQYWTVETMEDGSVAVALESAAKDWGADLLIVGCRGYNGAHRLLAGSVSTELVHRAHLPVLVVR
jgi:nucleotide-binding universal stress UspA family protein